jgi:hypothetical protein
LNYAVGGVWKPVNTVPAYMAWPGSPFDAENLTGFWRHSPGKLIVYSLSLLFGKHGFIGHNLPMFLLFAAIPLLRRRWPKETPELVLSMAWCIGVWILYAAFSNNYGGACCSIRWFVPFLAPAYFWIAVFLRERPDFRTDFVILSTWGAALGIIMWWKGPWITRMVPCFWQIQAGAISSWIAWRIYLRRRASRQAVPVESGQRPIAAAA